MKNVLFICSQNKLRSPTAEAIFTGQDNFEVASAGLDKDATVTVTPELLKWADIIFVMEKNHKNRLQKRFRKYLNKQKVICLGIPDNYEFMDPELVRKFKDMIPRLLHQ
jgi:predicted protein tyrosine phosphatase